MSNRCPQCGTPRVTATAFCTRCGRPFGPPAASYQHGTTVPAMPAQYGFQPPHRIRGSLIVGSVVGTMALLILMALLIHAVAGSSSGDDTSLPPIVAPLQGGTTFSNPTFSIQYPSGWTLGKNDDTQANLAAPAALGWPNEGTLFVQSSNGAGRGVNSFDIDMQSLLQSRLGSFPDANICRNPVDTTQAGQAGKDFVICLTQTAQNGVVIRIRDEYFVSVTAGRSAFYEVEWWSPENDHSQFIQDAAPLVASISWKLQ